jgi:hypothetical protein
MYHLQHLLAPYFAQSIYVFRLILGINSDYFLKQR